MPIPIPQPRYTVEKDDHFVRITLPSKKNIFYILATLLWLFMWAYFIFSFLYITLTLKQVIDIGKYSQPPEVEFIVAGIFFLFFFLVLIVFGVFGIYRFIWLLAGKEIIDVDTKLVKISQQTFLGKNEKEYYANEIKDLQVSVGQSRSTPFVRFQKLLNANGMIVFDYESKTFRFGLEIEEAEAKQIILAIKEGLAQ